MRVAFACWPTAAHLYPLVPLAWALRSAGHEVVVCSHPLLGPTANAAGLPFQPMCSEEEMPPPAGPTAAWPNERADVSRITEALDFSPENVMEVGTFCHGFLPSMWEFNPYDGSPDDPMPAMDGLVTFFRSWHPDLVVWDPCMPGAAVAARAVGASQVRQSGTDYNGWFLDEFERLTSAPGAPQVDNPLVKTLRGMAEKYDVPLDHDTLYGQWTLDVVPSGMNFPVDTRRVPMRWIPHTAQTAMPPWLYPVPERPRVAISLGLSVRKYVPGTDWGYVRTLFEALGRMDVEVVATLDKTQLAQVGSIPANVRAVDYLPLDTLMPTCSLLIHHGGIGTMAAAGCNGVPQLIVDFLDADDSTSAADTAASVPDDAPSAGKASAEAPTADNAPDGRIVYDRYKLAPVSTSYVTSFGAGEMLNLGTASVEDVCEQVARVLGDPSFKAGAERLRMDLMAAPSPSDLVPTLEKLALSR